MVISIPIAGEPGGLHDQAVSREVANGKGLLWPPVAMLGGPGNGGKWRITKISNMADVVGFCFSSRRKRKIGFISLTILPCDAVSDAGCS